MERMSEAVVAFGRAGRGRGNEDTEVRSPGTNLSEADECRPGPVRRRVLRGDGTVTPRDRLEVTEPGGPGEVLLPGRSRLVPDHPWVVAQPDLFRPTYSKDEVVGLKLEIAERQRRGRPGSSALRRRRWVLPEPRCQAPKLP
jgi:hypothetical protein